MKKKKNKSWHKKKKKKKHLWKKTLRWTHQNAKARYKRRIRNQKTYAEVRRNKKKKCLESKRSPSPAKLATFH